MQHQIEPCVGKPPKRAVDHPRLFSGLVIYRGSFLQTISPRHSVKIAVGVMAEAFTEPQYITSTTSHPLDQLSCQGEEIRLRRQELFLSNPCGLLSYYLIIPQVLINHCLTGCSRIFPGAVVRLNLSPRPSISLFLMANVTLTPSSSSRMSPFLHVLSQEKANDFVPAEATPFSTLE